MLCSPEKFVANLKMDRYDLNNLQRQIKPFSPTSKLDWILHAPFILIVDFNYYDPYVKAGPLR